MLHLLLFNRQVYVKACGHAFGAGPFIYCFIVGCLEFSAKPQVADLRLGSPYKRISGALVGALFENRKSFD